MNPLTQIKLGARAQKNQIRQGPSCKKRDKPSGSESSHLHGHETGSSAISPPLFKSGRRWKGEIRLAASPVRNPPPPLPNLAPAPLPPRLPGKAASFSFWGNFLSPALGSYGTGSRIGARFRVWRARALALGACASLEPAPGGHQGRRPPLLVFERNPGLLVCSPGCRDCIDVGGYCFTETNQIRIFLAVSIAQDRPALTRRTH